MNLFMLNYESVLYKKLDVDRRILLRPICCLRESDVIIVLENVTHEHALVFSADGIGYMFNTRLTEIEARS